MKRKKIYLINRYLEGSLSKEEEKEFERLKSLGEIDPNELDDFEKIVEHTRQTEIPEFETRDFSFSARQSSPLQERNPKTGMRTLLKLAAVLILGISLGGIVMYSLFNKRDKFVRVETKRGDKIHITLPGQNEAWLNSRSSIEYAESFKGTNRVITLKGEAYFRFSDTENSPIMVDCNQSQIICSHASLNIENDTLQNKVEIEVEEGWVAVTHPRFGDRQFIVEAGSKGVIDEMVPVWIEANNNPNYLAWHTGKMVFNKTTLMEVAQTLTEVYDIPVDVIGDVKYCFFTSQFNNENLKVVLRSIENAIQTQIRQERNSIIITGNPC